MAKRTSILLMTNSEYGQANPFLAIAYELLQRPNIDIHLASFSPLESRVLDLQERTSKDSIASNSTLNFHLIAGDSMLQALSRNKTMQSFAHPPGMKGAIGFYTSLPEFVIAWTGEEYVQCIDHCIKIIGDVNPDAIVVEIAFSQAREACNSMSREHILLSAVCALESFIQSQGLAMYWKFPALATGYPYPLPWYLIPVNIYLIFRVILSFILSPRVRKLGEYRKARGFADVVPVFKQYEKDKQYLCPSLPETEFPMFIPENVTFCGPILLPSTPVSDSDPELLSWLHQKPTILISMGTLVIMDDSLNREIASGLRLFLSRHPDVQVLWKIQKRYSYEEVTYQNFGAPDEIVNELLATELASGQVRIVNWLRADPVSILESGQIICSVNHGGSNTYHEAISAGIPQVILAQWYDTYRIARRVEYRGIGAYGNSSVAPHVEAVEFSQALMKVVGNEAMLARSRELAKLCGKEGGRKIAADKIMAGAMNIK